MNSKIFPIILLSILFSSLSFPQEVLTLEEAIKLALQNNYSISIAKNEAEISSNNSNIGNAGMLPEIDASGSYSKSITNTTQEFFDGRRVERDNAESSNLTAGVSLNWTVFDGLRMFAALDRLKALKETGELNFKSEVENNISNLITTYYDIVRLNEVLEVIRTNIQISEQRYKIAEDKLEVGSGSRFDLRQAQVDLNEDKSSLLREELNLLRAKILLNTFLAVDTKTDFSINDTILYKEDLILEDLFLTAKEKNSRLRIAEENKTVSDLEISLARSEIFPRISLDAGYDFSKSQSETGLLHINRNHGFNYGITASLNIFNGLTTRQNIENAEINFKNSELLYNEVVQLVEADLYNSYNRYENSRQIVALEKENLAAAEENLDIALERLRLGNITPLEFRETQIDFFNAKSRLVAAQFEAKSAETQLLRLSGQLITDL
ncbi:MAG TPA: TolC family protein [Ignavibacteriaceae bacterium]|nr:TolC family protein [Ignavibacteriaceae bacterium]